MFELILEEEVMSTSPGCFFGNGCYVWLGMLSLHNIIRQRLIDGILTKAMMRGIKIDKIEIKCR